MYIFEDRDAPIIADGQIVGYKQYLFKEAVNCIGFEKPEGALVTEAAAQLQELLCGPYSIPAFAALHEGKVVGSFQEKIDSIEADQRVDLFQWQTNPQDNIPAEMEQKMLDRKNGLRKEYERFFCRIERAQTERWQLV